MIREKDNSLSCVRFIAMNFIIVCHILQYYGNELAWWFNVGVQMFLWLSGYLGGCLVINEGYLHFYKKRIKKILVDYYVWIFLVLLFCTFINSLPDVKSLIHLFTITGGGDFVSLKHLWYIPTILFCYFLTPVLNELFNRFTRYKFCFFVSFIVTLAVIVEIYSVLIFDFFTGAWINCYMLGMTFKNISIHYPEKQKFVNVICVGMSIVMNFVQIYFDYFANIEISGYSSILFQIWCNYAHVFLGITCVLIIIKCYKYLCEYKFLSPILTWSDKYSYDIYLVHHIFILGKFSVLPNLGGGDFRCFT